MIKQDLSATALLAFFASTLSSWGQGLTCTSSEATLVFGNGINTTQSDAWRSAKKLYNATLPSITHGKEACLNYWVVYDTTYLDASNPNNARIRPHLRSGLRWQRYPGAKAIQLKLSDVA